MLQQVFMKVETRIGRRNKVKTIIYGVLLSAFLLTGYLLSRNDANELKLKGRYTVATTLRFTLTTKSGRGVAYEFYYNDVRYTSSSGYVYEAKVPGGRYLVRFSSEDPSVNDIYLNQPIPEHIVSPMSGWKSIKDIK